MSDSVTTADTLVLALGNPLRGDDGVGAAILAALTAARTLPPQVTLLDGGTLGLEMLLVMQDYGRVIIVDAGDTGRAPGEWVRLTPDVIISCSSTVHLSATLHSAGLAEALTLGAALGILPAEVIIYAVQPADVGWSPGLSAPVRQAIPAVCAAILDNLCYIG